MARSEGFDESDRPVGEAGPDGAAGRPSERPDAGRAARPEPPAGTVLLERLDGIRERTLADVARSSRRRELPRFLIGGAIGVAVLAVAAALIVGAVLRAPGTTGLPADPPDAVPPSVPASAATADAILQGITLPARSFSLGGVPTDLQVFQQPAGISLQGDCGVRESFARLWSVSNGGETVDSTVAFLRQHAPKGYVPTGIAEMSDDNPGAEYTAIGYASTELPSTGGAAATPFTQLSLSVSSLSSWGVVVRLDATVLPAGYACRGPLRYASVPSPVITPLPSPTGPGAAIPSTLVDDPDAASSAAHAKALFAAVGLPVGAQRVDASPSSYLSDVKSTLYGLDSCTGLAHESGYWTVPATSMAELVHFFQTHAPEGFTAGAVVGMAKGSATNLLRQTVEADAGESPTSRVSAAGSSGAGEATVPPQLAYDQVLSSVAKVSDGVFGIRIDVYSLPEASSCPDLPPVSHSLTGLERRPGSGATSPQG